MRRLAGDCFSGRAPIYSQLPTIPRGEETTCHPPPHPCITIETRVAELGSLSSGAKMAMKIFVKRVFTIFATNASFLRVIANLQI